MCRRLYSLLFYLGLPLIVLRLLWRARREPAYLRHLGERFGFYRRTPKAGRCLWLHAVSVGEMRAAEPLVRGLLSAYPAHRLLLTAMTPTGRATAESLFAGEPRIAIVYLPYDLPASMARFLAHFAPEAGVLMETEIWPNLLAAAARRRLPVLLANARLSRRSARGYAKVIGLARPALARLAAIGAQSPADRRRFCRLLGGAGAHEKAGSRPHIAICGNLKFDVTPAPALLAQGAAWRAALGGRPVWLAASTRDGEEAILLDIQRQLLARWPDVLLVLVPRHPQRFAAVADLVRRRGLALAARSARLPTAAESVWLGDSMGEMAAYYALADLAFIGGSLLPFGGQNLIEAAACSCPVLIGAHTFNFAQASADALAAGAARRVQDADELLRALVTLLADAPARARLAAAGRAFAARHRGATTRTLACIAQFVRPED
jgi:3-deoxy-D-manno-octulosonic-acid transferase